MFTIWNRLAIKLLQLKGISQHYNIYDCGSCLIGAPKDLFSHARTLEDALQTARVMAREAYQRKWTVEFVGFDKMARAARISAASRRATWKQLEIVHYTRVRKI